MNAAIVAVLVLVVGAKAQEPSRSPHQSSSKAVAKNGPPKVAGKQSSDSKSSPLALEAEALAFVDKNHPELATILPQLKKRHPREYQSAIRELSGSQQRLAKLAARDKASYDVELKIWQIDSRVRLLAAQIGMGADRDKLSGEIRRALVERSALELSRKQAQRKLMQSRLEKLDAEIARSSSRREERIEQALDKILSSVDKSSGRKPQNAPKPAKPAAPKSTQPSLK